MKRPDWRTDKKLITFSFVKKYCPHKQYDKHCLYYRCPKIERKPKAKYYPLCAEKRCPIWNKLEQNESKDRDSLLLEKIEKLTE